MSVYGELDPMVELRTQFASKGKREHISKDNIPNIAYPGQHIDIGIQKARSVVKNAGRALVKEKVLELGSKDIDTIDNSDAYDTYKDLYMSEKEREERLL